MQIAMWTWEISNNLELLNHFTTNISQLSKLEQVFTEGTIFISITLQRYYSETLINNIYVSFSLKASNFMNVVMIGHPWPDIQILGGCMQKRVVQISYFSY